MSKFIDNNWVWILLVLFVLPYFLPTDSSDKDWLNRSGFSVYRDNLTGCQYVKRGIFSSLTPRLTMEGKPMCGKTLKENE